MTGWQGHSLLNNEYHGCHIRDVLFARVHLSSTDVPRHLPSLLLKRGSGQEEVIAYDDDVLARSLWHRQLNAPVIFESAIKIHR